MSFGISADRRQALAIAGAGALVPIVGVAAAPARAVIPDKWILRDIPFDASWLFQRGGGSGFEMPAFDDTAWRRVDLPHDWSVEDIPGGQPPAQIGPFDKRALGDTATGYTVGGEGWYRKHFRVEEYPQNARIEIAFDGIYLESQVYLNGHALGGSVSGYMPFNLDLSPYLNRQGDNVLAVRVTNEGRNTRWYAGSGIYRPVTLEVMPADCHLARWGIAASTRSFAAGKAHVDVVTSIEGTAPGLQLVTRLRDADGQIAAESRSPVTRKVSQSLELRGARLWSPDDPNLYQLETELRRGDTVLDQVVQPFGIRIVTFDPQRGMAINGTVTNLRGGCVHHDNGLLGACAFRDADERRVRLLKARGFNAIRSSHNTASRSLRETCDRLGMLLIEEAFDAWHEHKEPQDFSTRFAQHWEEVVRAMVLSARNSPSVIMWSIGNEIPFRATEEGVAWEWKLANAVKHLDSSRPVTAGLNGVLGQEMVAGADAARPGRAGKVDNASTIFIDVPGYNYRLADIEREHGSHPERVVYGSETFAREVFDYAGLMERAPYFLGEFLWTAMDYIGEAGLGATAFLKKGGFPFYLAKWPWVNAWCGDLDLIGCQKAASLARDVAWGRSPLAMTVQRPVPEGSVAWVANWGWPDELASWTWRGQEGVPLTVRLYTPGDKVQLLLDGKPVGEKMIAATDKMTAEIMVPYAPGRLEAIAWKQGKVVGRTSLETVGDAAALAVTLEAASHRKGREALAYLRIDVVDSAGRVLPEAEPPLSLAIEGAGELAAFGSANPHATGSLKSIEAAAFRGRALAIVRGTTGGAVQVSVSSSGLRPATARFELG
ncbi:sugar-binding domain-containing protein (plasmid) [Novosphingobium sp. BL-8A]|uniref:glycoside hydrolase family 2 protein n=1 Tax=Novosphingobium sp. BL-8A TaxID=3127639 RepID=UPI0037576ED4